MSDAAAERTVEFPLGPGQRSKLAPYLKAQTTVGVLIVSVGSIGMAVYIRFLLGPDGGPVPALAGAAFAGLMVAYLVVKGLLVGRERVALRTTGYIPVKFYGSRIGPLSGGYALAGRYVLAGRRKVWLDVNVPETTTFGAVDYTKREAFALAFFDTTGRLVWSRSGYEPTTVSIDSMRVIA
jgi:hypothetical protein